MAALENKQQRFADSARSGRQPEQMARGSRCDAHYGVAVAQAGLAEDGEHSWPAISHPSSD